MLCSLGMIERYDDILNSPYTQLLSVTDRDYADKEGHPVQTSGMNPYPGLLHFVRGYCRPLPTDPAAQGSK